MPDMSFFPDGFEHAPAVKPVVKHAVAHATHVAAAVKPAIHHAALTAHKGFSMLTLFLTSVFSSAAGFGLGWYIKGRGFAGVKIDMANIKKDVEDLKNKISPPVVAVAPTA